MDLGGSVAYPHFSHLKWEDIKVQGKPMGKHLTRKQLYEKAGNAFSAGRLSDGYRALRQAKTRKEGALHNARRMKKKYMGDRIRLG